MTNIAISYARYSSEPQSQGHSLKRQLDEADKYAAANGLVIDQSLSFTDLGVSAWDKTNIEKGALGLFLQAVRLGKVPSGATLIVESFDRLSRAKPREALPIFTTIINAGLRIVTLTDPPKVFTAATVDANMFQLMEALMEMHRAHGESERKSQLVSKSWAERRTKAAESKTVMTSKAPLWLQSVGKRPNLTFEFIPERVQVVKRVIELALSGVGNGSIVKTLNSEGISSWPRSAKEEQKRSENGLKHMWQESYVQKMLVHRALYGAVEIKGGEVIEDYYPKIIDKDQFIYLQALRSKRAKSKITNRKGDAVTNLFSGLIYCGYCGSKMNVSGYTPKKTGIQVKQVCCHGARTGGTKCKMFGWNLRELEPDVLFWMTNLDYGKLVGKKADGDVEAEQKKLAVIADQIDEAKTGIDNLVEFIMKGTASEAAQKKLANLEAELPLLIKQYDEQEKMVAVLSSKAGGGSSRMKALIPLFKMLKEQDPLKLRIVREQLSAAIAQVLVRMTLYPVGRTLAGNRADRFAELQFVTGDMFTIDSDGCGPKKPDALDQYSELDFIAA